MEFVPCKQRRPEVYPLNPAWTTSNTTAVGRQIKHSLSTHTLFLFRGRQDHKADMIPFSSRAQLRRPPPRTTRRCLFIHPRTPFRDATQRRCRCGQLYSRGCFVQSFGHVVDVGKSIYSQGRGSAVKVHQRHTSWAAAVAARRRRVSNINLKLPRSGIRR